MKLKSYPIIFWLYSMPCWPWRYFVPVHKAQRLIANLLYLYVKSSYAIKRRAVVIIKLVCVRILTWLITK